MALVFVIILGVVVVKYSSRQKVAPVVSEIVEVPKPKQVAPAAPQKITPVAQPQQVIEDVPLPEPAVLTAASDQPAPTQSPEVEVAKMDTEKLFLEYRQEELVKLPPPVLGQEVEVYYSNGDVMLQTPLAVDENRGVVKMKMAYGSAEVHYSSFTRPCAEGYIPRLKAERLAQKRVSENMAAFIASAKAARHSSTQPLARRNNSNDPAVYFLPIPTSTSEDLLLAEQEMQAYLKSQSRRSGQNITVIHSSLEEDDAIIYLEVGTAFSKQNVGSRYQLAEGLRQFWGLRCMGNGVASDTNAFLVLVASGKIVGGSKVKQAATIWVR
jgi:hypothetical protein